MEEAPRSKRGNTGWDELATRSLDSNTGWDDLGDSNNSWSDYEKERDHEQLYERVIDMTTAESGELKEGFR